MSSRSPWKYFVSYPYSILSICKLTIIAMYCLTFFTWELSSRRYLGIPYLFIPVDCVIGSGVSAISLWFMVMKCYYRSLELTFDFIGLSLSFSGFLCLIVLGYSLLDYATLSHFFCTCIFSFTIYWVAVHTAPKNVSNLFICHWGENTESVEIETLDQPGDAT